MQITSNQFKHCDLVKVAGRIDSGTAPQFAEALNAVTDAGRFRIVVDLGEVNYMSSAGLRVLVNAQKTCKRYNRGEVVLSNVPANILAALDLAGFVPLFKIFDDITTAVGSF
jgi:anti-sigma B factor antagonist